MGRACERLSRERRCGERESQQDQWIEGESELEDEF
ncbi:hypothetical protein COLO4_12294 [Corchorus olitorius]|uniref:Uncharacterized protein n=1 Tax=Corchorus olitorius TaxID=93759 RepID=A0A1R3K1C4_9ROSI|nr:hypothetical protein COLO4_12294 [Corchorus olitorius]